MPRFTRRDISPCGDVILRPCRSDIRLLSKTSYGKAVGVRVSRVFSARQESRALCLLIATTKVVAIKTIATDVTISKCTYFESCCYHLQFSIADFFINLRQFIFVLNKKEKAALPLAYALGSAAFFFLFKKNKLAQINKKVSNRKLEVITI